jgi:hypothetical protein
MYHFLKKNEIKHIKEKKTIPWNQRIVEGPRWQEPWNHFFKQASVQTKQYSVLLPAPPLFLLHVDLGTNLASCKMVSLLS